MVEAKRHSNMADLCPGEIAMGDLDLPVILQPRAPTLD
jgi:hypothetical protein